MRRRILDIPFSVNLHAVLEDVLHGGDKAVELHEARADIGRDADSLEFRVFDRSDDDLVVSPHVVTEVTAVDSLDLDDGEATSELRLEACVQAMRSLSMSCLAQ